MTPLGLTNLNGKNIDKSDKGKESSQTLKALKKIIDYKEKLYGAEENRERLKEDIATKSELSMML